MPVTINYDSIRTHLHTMTTVGVVLAESIAYAFHEPHSPVIPAVVVSSAMLFGLVWWSTQYLSMTTMTDITLCRMKQHGVRCGFLW